MFLSPSKTIKPIGMMESETKNYLDQLTNMLSEKNRRMDAYTSLNRFKKDRILAEIKRWTKAQNQFN